MNSSTKSIEFVKTVFGGGIVDQSRTNIAVECPECGKGTGKKKLSINLSTWQSHCWVCGLKSKNLVYILKKYFNRSILEFYIENFDIKTSIKSGNTVANNLIEEKVKLPAGFLPLALNLHLKDPDVKACVNYLKKRGLSVRDFWRYRIGTCLTGKFKRRIIIPSFDNTGELNYYVARAIDEQARPKYLNSSNKKTEIIFNEIDIDWSKEITIVEGPFDLIKAGENTVCLLGSGIGKNSLLFNRLIKNRAPVILALDSDMTEKAFKLAEFLESYCCEVKLVNLGDFSDVGEMSVKDFKLIKSSAVRFRKHDFLSHKINSIRSGSLI